MDQDPGPHLTLQERQLPTQPQPRRLQHRQLRSWSRPKSGQLQPLSWPPGRRLPRPLPRQQQLRQRTLLRGLVCGRWAMYGGASCDHECCWYQHRLTWTCEKSRSGFLAEVVTWLRCMGSLSPPPLHTTPPLEPYHQHMGGSGWQTGSRLRSQHSHNTETGRRSLLVLKTRESGHAPGFGADGRGACEVSAWCGKRPRL